MAVLGNLNPQEAHAGSALSPLVDDAVANAQRGAADQRMLAFSRRQELVETIDVPSFCVA